MPFNSNDTLTRISRMDGLTSDEALKEELHVYVTDKIDFIEISPEYYVPTSGMDRLPIPRVGLHLPGEETNAVELQLI